MAYNLPRKSAPVIRRWDVSTRYYCVSDIAGQMGDERLADPGVIVAAAAQRSIMSDNMNEWGSTLEGVLGIAQYLYPGPEGEARVQKVMALISQSYDESVLF